MVSRFSFANSPGAYKAWCVLFRSEMDLYELEDVLSTNPVDFGQSNSDELKLNSD